MPYEVILFDLDDTLIDFTAAEAIGLRKIYEQFYLATDYETFEVIFKEINALLWSRVGAKENGLMPSDVRFLRFKQLNERINCSATAHEVADNYEHHLGEYIDWLPDVKPAVEFLHKKGHILGIITNGFAESQSKKGQKLALHNWFDCFVISDDVGIAKPNKEIFGMAVEKIANKREQPLHTYNKNSILMVGDSLISDGHGAMNFGISYCHISTNGQEIKSSEARITYHLSSVARLPACMGYEAEYELFLNSL